MAKPRIILADEPTGNLGSKNGKEVMDLLCGLHSQGSTIVMVTHPLHDASYADRIINIYDGEVVEHTLYIKRHAALCIVTAPTVWFTTTSVP